MKAYIILTLSLMSVNGLVASDLQNSEDDIYGPGPAHSYSVDEIVDIANSKFSADVSVDEILAIANLSLDEIESAPKSSLGASSRSTLPLSPLEQTMMRVYGVRTVGAKKAIEDIASGKGMTVAQFLGLVPQKNQ